MKIRSGQNLVLHQEYVLKSDSLEDYPQSHENCNGFYYEMSYGDYSIFIYEKKKVESKTPISQCYHQNKIAMVEASVR